MRPTILDMEHTLEFAMLAVSALSLRWSYRTYRRERFQAGSLTKALRLWMRNSTVR